MKGGGIKDGGRGNQNGGREGESKMEGGVIKDGGRGNQRWRE